MSLPTKTRANLRKTPYGGVSCRSTKKTIKKDKSQLELIVENNKNKNLFYTGPEHKNNCDICQTLVKYYDSNYRFAECGHIYHLRCDSLENIGKECKRCLDLKLVEKIPKSGYNQKMHFFDCSAYTVCSLCDVKIDKDDGNYMFTDCSHRYHVCCPETMVINKGRDCIKCESIKISITNPKNKIENVIKCDLCDGEIESIYKNRMFDGCSHHYHVCCPGKQVVNEKDKCVKCNIIEKTIIKLKEKIDSVEPETEYERPLLKYNCDTCNQSILGYDSFYTFKDCGHQFHKRCKGGDECLKCKNSKNSTTPPDYFLISASSDGVDKFCTQCNSHHTPCDPYTIKDNPNSQSLPTERKLSWDTSKFCDNCNTCFKTTLTNYRQFQFHRCGHIHHKGCNEDTKTGLCTICPKGVKLEITKEESTKSDPVETEVQSVGCQYCWKKIDGDIICYESKNYHDKCYIDVMLSNIKNGFRLKQNK